MYDLTLRYLCSAFVDAESIVPKPRVVADFLDVLQDDSLEAITTFERSATEEKARILLRRRDEPWQLLLGSKRFDVSLAATKPGTKPFRQFGSFCKDAGATLGICLSYFHRKAHRLAAVQEGLLPDMPELETERIIRRLVNLPPTFSEQIPFEWDWKCASRIERTFAWKKETTITIATIKKVTGTLAFKKNGEEISEEFDRLRLDFDINTTPDETVARFGEKQVRGFFNKAGTWHKALSEEVLRFTAGD